jgi:zinc protease
VWIRTLPNAQAHFALRAAMREVRKLVDDGMSKEDFELTREFLRKYVLHFASTTTGRLGYAVDDRFYGVDGEGHLARFRKMMDSITHEEVNEAIRKHLQYDDVKIAIVTGEAESLRAALASDAPSPMTYESEKPLELLEEDKEIATFALDIPESSIRVVPLEEMFR